jgi:hypothetical protein
MNQINSAMYANPNIQMPSFMGFSSVIRWDSNRHHPAPTNALLMLAVCRSIPADAQ